MGHWQALCGGVVPHAPEGHAAVIVARAEDALVEGVPRDAGGFPVVAAVEDGDLLLHAQVPQPDGLVLTRRQEPVAVGVPLQALHWFVVGGQGGQVLAAGVPQAYRAVLAAGGDEGGGGVPRNALDVPIVGRHLLLLPRIQEVKDAHGAVVGAGAELGVVWGEGQVANGLLVCLQVGQRHQLHCAVVDAAVHAACDEVLLVVAPLHGSHSLGVLG